MFSPVIKITMLNMEAGNKNINKKIHKKNLPNQKHGIFPGL